MLIFSVTLYPSHSVVSRGKLMLRILEALCVEWRNSTPRFASTPEMIDRWNIKYFLLKYKMKVIASLLLSVSSCHCIEIDIETNDLQSFVIYIYNSFVPISIVRIIALIGELLTPILYLKAGSVRKLYRSFENWITKHCEASRGAVTACDCKTDWLWVRSPLVEMEYLLKFIFPFLRSGVEVKRGVGFCHLTRNASKIQQKVGNGVSYTKFLLPTLLCAG